MRFRFVTWSWTLLLLTGVVLTSCSKDPARSFERAKELVAKGDRAGAIIELKSAIQSAPSDGAMRFLLGQIYNEKFDGASAEKELLKARALGIADDGHLSVEIARALRIQGKFSELLKLVPAVVSFEHSQLTSVYALRGRAQHALRFDEDAKASFTQAVKLDPTNPDVGILEAQIKIGQKDFVGALKAIDAVLAKSPSLYDAWSYKAEILRFLDRADDALSAYGEVLKINPTDFRALLTRPTFLLRKGKLDEAEADVNLLMRFYRGHPLAFVQQGAVRLAKADPRGALESAELALKTIPDLGAANMLAGAANYAQKSYVLAEQYLRKGLVASPHDPMTRRLLASTLLELGEPQSALETIESAITDDARDSRNFIIAGDAQLRLGHSDKAAALFERAAALDPEDSTPKIKGALIKLGVGDEDVGLDQLESALERNPAPSRADEMLILTYLRRKEVDRAEQALARLEKGSPGNSVLGNLRGIVLMARGKQADAVKVFEATLAKEPTFLPAADNLAELDLMAKNPDAARGRYAKVLAADDKNVQAMLAIASIEHNLGREKEEQTMLEQAVAAVPGVFAPRERLVRIYLRNGAKNRAMTIMDEALAVTPNDPAVIVRAAQTQFATGNPNRAIDTVKQLLRIAPKSEPAHLLLARFQGAVGQVEEAEKTLRTSLGVNSSYPDTQVALVGLLVAQKKFADATKYVQSVQSTQPKSPIGFILEGEIYESKGEFKDAVRAYRAALERQAAGEIAVKIYRAEIRSGDREGAFAHLNQWLDAHPDNPPVRTAVAEAWLDKGDYKTAVMHYERVMKNPPVPSLVRNGLAWAYYKLKDPRALATAQSAYQSTPNSGPIADTLGWILVEQGEVARGLPYLQHAVALEPENLEIGYHLASALAKSGDRVAAREKLTKILAAGKTFTGVKDAQALLESLK